MARKNVADTVQNMLSVTGAETRPVQAAPAPLPEDRPQSMPAAQIAAPTPPAPTIVAPPAEEPSAPAAQAPATPRTLRLRTDTAAALRAAWLEAKRDDVLLTYQDFASTLLDDAIASRRRRARTSRLAANQ